MKLHIKKGDTVIVRVGDDKGKKGTVIKALPKIGKVIVEGINTVKKHQKAGRANSKGQMIEKAMPMSVSNLTLVESGAKPKSSKVKAK